MSSVVLGGKIYIRTCFGGRKQHTSSVEFVNSQNLEYGNMDDKYPKFEYGYCLTKKKLYRFYTFHMNHIYR